MKTNIKNTIFIFFLLSSSTSFSQTTGKIEVNEIAKICYQKDRLSCVKNIKTYLQSNKKPDNHIVEEIYDTKPENLNITYYKYKFLNGKLEFRFNDFYYPNDYESIIIVYNGADLNFENFQLKNNTLNFETFFKTVKRPESISTKPDINFEKEVIALSIDKEIMPHYIVEYEFCFERPKEYNLPKRFKLTNEVFDYLKSQRLAYIRINLTSMPPAVYQTTKKLNQRFGEHLITSRNSKVGVIDDAGKIIVPFKYDYIDHFRGDFAKVKVGNKIGIINTEGKEILPPKFDDVDYGYMIRFNRFKCRIYNLFGIYESSGEELVPVEFENIEIYGDKISFGVTKNNKQGFYRNHRLIIPCEYDAIRGFSKSQFNLVKNNKAGTVDLLNKIIIPFEYDNITVINDTLYKANKNNMEGLLNSMGTIIVPFIYEKIEAETHEKICAKKNGKWGFTNNKGDVLIDFIYEKVSIFINGLAPVKLNGLYGYIDINSNTIIPFEFSYAGIFNIETTRVEKNGKSFYIDKTGKCVENCN